MIVTAVSGSAFSKMRQWRALRATKCKNMSQMAMVEEERENELRMGYQTPLDNGDHYGNLRCRFERG